MTTLAAVDLKILRALQENGGLSNVELSERVGMSPSPCLRRVKQLEAEGLIGGYVALLDRRKVGLGVMAYVEVKAPANSDSASVEKFRNAVQREPAVVGCYVMAGGFDFLLKIVVEDLDAYADFAVNRLLRMPGVTDIRSSFVMESVKDTTALPLEHLTPRAPPARSRPRPGSRKRRKP